MKIEIARKGITLTSVLVNRTSITIMPGPAICGTGLLLTTRADTARPSLDGGSRNPIMTRMRTGKARTAAVRDNAMRIFTAGEGGDKQE